MSKKTNTTGQNDKEKWTVKLLKAFGFDVLDKTGKTCPFACKCYLIVYIIAFIVTWLVAWFDEAMSIFTCATYLLFAVLILMRNLMDSCMVRVNDKLNDNQLVIAHKLRGVVYIFIIAFMVTTFVVILCENLKTAKIVSFGLLYLVLCIVDGIVPYLVLKYNAVPAVYKKEADICDMPK